MYFFDNFNPGYKEVLGARYLVCSLDCPIIGTPNYLNYNSIWFNSKYRILENDGAYAFVTLPKKVILGSNITESLNFLNQVEQSASILDQDSEITRVLDVDCSLKDYENTNFTSITAKIECQSGGYLVLGAYNDGNWVATTNKISKKIELANGYFVGLELPTGKSTIEIEHKSRLRLASIKFSALILTFYFASLCIFHRKWLWRRTIRATTFRAK
jgi:hypothetical protein